MRHHAIVVTAGNQIDADNAYKKAIEIYTREPRVSETGQSWANLITPIHGPLVNEYYSFAILPDGSKTGWGASVAGHTLREEFISWLRMNYCDWVEVAFGGDDYEVVHVRHDGDSEDVGGAE